MPEMGGVRVLHKLVNWLMTFVAGISFYPFDNETETEIALSSTL